MTLPIRRSGNFLNPFMTSMPYNQTMPMLGGPWTGGQLWGGPQQTQGGLGSLFNGVFGPTSPYLPGQGPWNYGPSSPNWNGPQINTLPAMPTGQNVGGGQTVNPFTTTMPTPAVPAGQQVVGQGTPTAANPSLADWVGLPKSL